MTAYRLNSLYNVDTPAWWYTHVHGPGSVHMPHITYIIYSLYYNSYSSIYYYIIYTSLLYILLYEDKVIILF